MTQCSILIVSDRRCEIADRKALRAAGFLVHESAEWPADSSVSDFHIFLIEFSPVSRASLIAARLRAKRGVGNRVSIACVPNATAQERRDALDAGFDAVIDRSCSARQQIATVVSAVRSRPEFKCILPPRGRKAA